MAKDDYHVIVFKILTYYYGILKRKIVYEEEVFKRLIGKEIPEDYLETVIIMMNEKDIRITPKGVEYLQENTMMKKAAATIIKIGDIAISLLSIV